MIANVRLRSRLGLFRITICAALLISAHEAAFGQELKQASSILAAKIGESQRKRVAVVDFTDLCGNVSRFGRYLAEELSGSLVDDAKGFRVMDRAHLQAILQEHKLATTGPIDPQTARQLGQFAGVDTLVTGTITSAFGETVRVMLKALDVSTAEIIAQSTADIPKTDAIKSLLGSDSESSCDGNSVQSNQKAEPRPVARAAGAGAEGSSSNPPAPQGKAADKHPIFETEAYRVSFDSVRQSSRTVTVTLTFQNISEKKISLGWGQYWGNLPTDNGPYLVDENGEKWVLLASDDAQIVWKPGYGLAEIQPGTKLKTKFVFGGSGNGRSFTLVCTEDAPKPGRDIVVYGLTAD